MNVLHTAECASTAQPLRVEAALAPLPSSPIYTFSSGNLQVSHSVLANGMVAT